MAPVNIGNGDYVATVQSLLMGENAYIAQGGSLVVWNNSALSAAGQNHIMVAGEIASNSSGIVVNGNNSNITVTATGSVQTSGSSAPTIQTSTGITTVLFNYGQIGTTGGGEVFRGSGYIVNAGSMHGWINFQADADFYTQRGAGQVFGRVDLDGGDDTYRVEYYAAGVPTQRVDGGAGHDELDLRDFGAAVWVDLDYAGAEVWTKFDQDLKSSNPWKAVADISGFEEVIGSDNSDYLSGGAGNDTFFYSGGIDDIRGDGGSDTYDARDDFDRGMWVDLAFNGREVWTRDTTNVNAAAGTWRQVADLTSIENIHTTKFTDNIAGNDADNILYFEGRLDPQLDLIAGRGGSDTIDFTDNDEDGVWVSLAYAGPEAWTKDIRDVNQPNGTFRAIADLSGIENIVGSKGGDYLAGDGLANRIEGGRHNDILRGNGGADQFVFNLGSEARQGQTSAHRDTIEDFLPGTDRIGISGVDTLPAIVFNNGPMGTGQTLHYNSTTGILSYDVDGSGALLATEIAILSGAPTLTGASFFLL